MEFEKALQLAKKFIGKHPFLILSGSVALILNGEIHEREVGDIDFVVNDKDLRSSIFNEGLEDILDGEYGGGLEAGDESCDLVNNFKSECGTFNVLVYKNNTPIFKENEKFDGMSVQISQQIWHYKNKMKRNKDILDLL